MSSVQNYLSDVPVFTLPIVNTESPNYSIYLIKQKKFKIKTKDREVEVNGNIEFKWFPQSAVYFEGNTEFFPNLNMEEENFEILTAEDEVLGEGFIIQEKFESGEYFIQGIFSLECIKGEPSIPVKEVRFVIPNMRRFDGLNIKHKSKGYSGRISLTLEGKEIVFDQLPDFKRRMDDLKKAGGYHITYSGKMIFKEPKSLKDLKQEKDILNCFLQLLNGKQVSGLFFTGIHEDEVVWQDFRPYPVETYHERGYSCFPIFLRKEDIESLSVLYKNIEIFWNEENQKTMIKLAVAWYLEANTKPYYHFDTSVIISQSGLEMFYNWLLVEKHKIIRGKTNLSAANKIRLLISKFGLTNRTPEKYTTLQNFLSDPKNKNVEDVVDAIVLYRNSIVHGEYEKRMKLQNFSPAFKREAKHLSIWYLELSILYILGYKGRYNDRTTAVSVSDTEKLPW